VAICCWLYLACDLDDDTPACVLQELSWHIGLTEDQPDVVTLPVACRKYGLFDLKWGSLWAAGPQTAVLRRLKRYVREPAGSGNGDATWVHSLLARVDFGDDMVDDIIHLVRWIAPHCVTEGWVGGLSVRPGDDPVGPLELHFYVHGRRPYLGRAGATPQAWDTDSPDYPYTHG
jgi:hypothetical protein